MDSRTAAHVLAQIGSFLELRGENRFKSRAYASAARAVQALDTDDLGPMLRSGELAGAPGIGPATLSVIRDLVELGESSYLERLRESTPEGLLEMLRVPGLGPTKIHQIRRDLGIATVQELEDAARDGRRLLAAVAAHPDVEQAEIAGAVRRHREIVRDIDVVAACRGDPASVAT